MRTLNPVPLHPKGTMSLPWTLALLAQELAIPAPGTTVLLEVLGPDRETGQAAVHLDEAAEELVVETSARTWKRVQNLFEADPSSKDALLRIHLPYRQIPAASIATALQEQHPHLDVLADPRTNSVFVSNHA